MEKCNKSNYIFNNSLKYEWFTRMTQVPSMIWIKRFGWVWKEQQWHEENQNSMTFFFIRMKNSTFHSTLIIKNNINSNNNKKKVQSHKFGWFLSPVLFFSMDKKPYTAFNFNQESRHDWISTDALHIFLPPIFTARKLKTKMEMSTSVCMRYWG